MRSEKGITLTSLIIYVIAMSIVIGLIATMTKYFYGNLNYISDRTASTKEYTSFNAFITAETNEKGNQVLKCENTYIVFSNGHQYTYDSDSNAIYMNKIQICSNVTSCSFSYNENKLTINITLDKPYTNTYNLESEG